MALAAVEAHGIALRYGSRVALEDLTFAVPEGEIVGVLGPNGAGKTTAIRILTTILPGYRGSFSVAGISGARPAQIRARVGVLPESSGYPERQSGEEYLCFHARLFGQRAASARAVARSLLEEVGLTGRGRSPIAQYSRGMRQRLGIARALVNNPAVLFLDEPTLGLDPAGQREILARVGALARERGTTVLLSTHLLDEAEAVCTRVLILNAGRVVADGSVSDIAARANAACHAHVRVARADAERAAHALSGSQAICSVLAGTETGELTLRLAEPGDGSLNAVLGLLLEAGVPVLAGEIERARLSDAFLTMTADR